MDCLRRRYSGIDFTVVADTAMINKKNEKALQERKIPYVLWARLNNLPSPLAKKVLSEQEFCSLGRSECSSNIAHYCCLKMELGRNVISSEEEKGKYLQLVITHSPKRARKDKHDRQRKLDKLRKKLANSKQPASLDSGGNAHYLDIPKGQVQLSEAKIKRMAQWDGLRGIVTWGCEEMDARNLVIQYRQLATIESCFRINKHDLKIRPVFHWKELCVRLHLAICYMAFCCVQHLRYRLQARGCAMSAKRIQTALNKMQISLLRDTKNGGLYGMPSQIGSDAHKICQVVGLQWNPIPFRVLPDEEDGSEVRYDEVA